MELKIIDADFTVCKIHTAADADWSGKFVFLSKTDEEISLVCESEHVPANAVETESGWKALRFTGILDFGMTGVISKISGILSQAKISVFVVSTYNTDYILIKSSDMEKSVALLENNAYTVRHNKY